MASDAQIEAAINRYGEAVKVAEYVANNYRANDPRRQQTVEEAIDAKAHLRALIAEADERRALEQKLEAPVRSAIQFYGPQGALHGCQSWIAALDDWDARHTLDATPPATAGTEAR